MCPAINITGSGNNTGSDNSSSDSSDDSAPTGAVSSRSQRIGGIRKAAEAENKVWNDRRRQLRQVASYEEANAKARERYQQREAQYQRQEASWIDSNFSAIKKNYKAEATWENQNFDLRKRHARQEADYMNREHTSRVKQTERLGKQWDRAYESASKINSRIDDRKASAVAYNTRYQADFENRVWEQQRQPQRGLVGNAFHHVGRVFRGRGGAIGRFGKSLGTLGEGGGIAGELEGGAMLEGGAALDGGAIGAAIAAAGLLTAAVPKLYSSALSSFVSGAKPWYDLTDSANAFGRGANFNGQDLISSLYNDGRAAKPWMRNWGIGPQDAMDITRRSGQTIGGSDSMRAVVESVMAASRSTFLGDVPQDQLESMLANFTRVSGSGNRGNSQGNFSGMPGYTGTGQANNYWRTLQGVMSQATQEGLDHSRVGDTLNTMLTADSTRGSASVNPDAQANLWNRLTSSGAPMMRDGTGVITAQSAANNEINSIGYGGNPFSNMATQFEVRKRGGLPKSMSQLENLYGFKYGSLSKDGQLAANQALQAAQSGDMLGFATMSKPLMGGDFALQANQDYAASAFGAGDYRSTAIAAALNGAGGTPGLTIAQAFQSGDGGSLKPGPGLGMSDLDPTLAGNITTDATAAGVAPGIIASLMRKESSFNPNATNGNHIGLGQISPGALADLQQHGKDTNIRWDQLYDAKLNTQVTSDYVGLLQSRYGSQREGLKHYLGSKSDADNSAYADSIIAGSTSFGGNTNPTQNSVTANAQQAALLAAKQDARGAESIGTNGLGDVLQGVASGAGAVTKEFSDLLSSMRSFKIILDHTNGTQIGNGRGSAHIYGSRPPKQA